jgi:hypothetical protein
MTPVRAAWQVWKARAHDIGQFQSRVLLTVFYFTIFVPFALVMRLFSDPLLLRRGTRSTNWCEWPAREAGLDAARRQF